jgi:hypothetical protein
MSSDEPNPYAPPQIPQEAAAPALLSADQVRRRLAVPAYGILASVLVNVAWLAWMLTMVAWGVIAGASITVQAVVWLTVTLFSAALINYAAVSGALAMLRLDDYRAALRGAWFSIVPCNVGCLVALPFALWADWLLRDPRVHAAFAQRRTGF